jgi:dipeptidyl-peptidase-4
MVRTSAFSAFAFALLLWSAGSAQSPTPARKKPVTLADIAPAGAGVSGTVKWAPGGDRFVISTGGSLSVYDVKTGKQREILALSKLDSAAAKTTPPEITDWTNRRVSQREVQWFTDNRRLLVLAGGDLFVVDSEKGSFESLLHTSDEERDPKLSPNDKFVSFRRGHDLYAVDVETKAVTRLTTDGADTLLNGELDWVYPEELELNTAHWWSPDSRSVAYLQFDTSREPVFPQVSLLNARGVLEPEHYPKAGDPNAGVRLGVVAVSGGETKWMDLGSPFDHLLARVVWSPNSREIMAVRLNRVQNQLDLMLANAQTGAAKSVLHEEDKYWINLRGEPQFLGAGDRFLWTSEQTGYRHLYICGTDGSKRAQLTSGDWEVDRIVGVDEKRQQVFFTSTEASPVERQLYSVGFDGSGKRRLTEGAGTHSASISPDAAYYLDDYSSVSSPVRSVIYSGDGRQVAVYREADRASFDTYDLQPVENVPVKAADGTALYAHLIKPAGFQPDRKYPAIVMIYGGPDVQRVTDSWSGLTWEQALAHKGFVIWQLDNRGSKGRGHAFESVIYHNMGASELEDQQEGIRHLISLGFVDPQRIGMYGWSYGGYMTLYTVTHAPGLIKAAIAGAPVTNWRNYDSIYTERYMGLPEENAAGYKASSPAEAAANLGDTKLLILHNIEDDNVHFQNTLQMASALESAGKNFFMVVYPGKQHGLTGAPRRQMLDESTKFFEDNLK